MLLSRQLFSTILRSDLNFKVKLSKNFSICEKFTSESCLLDDCIRARFLMHLLKCGMLLCMTKAREETFRAISVLFELSNRHVLDVLHTPRKALKNMEKRNLSVALFT